MTGERIDRSGGQRPTIVTSARANGVAAVDGQLLPRCICALRHVQALRVGSRSLAGGVTPMLASVYEDCSQLHFEATVSHTLGAYSDNVMLATSAADGAVPASVARFTSRLARASKAPARAVKLATARAEWSLSTVIFLSVQ